MDFPFPTDIAEFAKFLMQSGAAGLIVERLLEKIPAFHDWKGKGKGLFVLGVFILLPYAGQGLQLALAKLEPGTLALVQNSLNAALVGLGAWTASQWSHLVSANTGPLPPLNK